MASAQQPDSPAVPFDSNMYFSDTETNPRYNNHRRGTSRVRGTSRGGATSASPGARISGDDGESLRSQRPLAPEEEGEPSGGWDGPRHPDAAAARSYSRARPPRTHLNRPYNYDNQGEPLPPFAGEPTEDPFYERPRSRRRDEEMGFGTGWGYSPRYTGSTKGGFGDQRYTDQQRLHWEDLSPQERREVMRLPWMQWMNSNVKNHFVAAVGEFVGTTLFLFFAFGGTTVANIQSKANNSNQPGENNTTTGDLTGFNVNVLMYISLSFGLSLMVNVWIFFRISGGLFNPAVTLGLLLTGGIGAIRAVCLFFAQMLGGMFASVLVNFLFPENFNVRTTLGGGASLAQGVFIEAILTAELVFCIFMLAKEKHRGTFIAPIGIGLALFIAELVGVQFTGGSLNPARSFGPCVVTATFDREHWIYWVGPMIGSLIAVALYKLFKMLEYEMANPGADGDPTNDPTKNPEKHAEVTMARTVSNINTPKVA
ncbi:aquaporin-1 [Plectosphaerella cucumerina]|uniref:Aquaporin-1 n=1 Tax=Plectosphaerella cucumerina TaxID=40658 RepID=A0A8K0T3U7_9PEZI|nr:aquaporin-1 [Plectosphaerella cucumerina]